MTEKDRRIEIFEKLPVPQAVCKQIVPAIVSQMIALIYNLGDTYFVGMLNDPSQTAAVTIVGSSFVMLTAISNLFGVGGASLIAQFLGKRDQASARQTSAMAFYGGLASSLVFSLVFLALAKPILTLCGATEATYDLAFGYAWWVVILGGPANILNTLLGNLVRSEGSAVAASFGMSFGGILNFILDPFFILPQFLGLGVVGAGLATAISNGVAFLFFIGYILRKKDTTILSLSPRQMLRGRHLTRRILSIGLPSSIQFALTVVAVAAQSHFVSPYGPEALAGLGITKKLDQLPLYFSIGVANGLMPLLAFNYAAGNFDRQRKAFRLGCTISCGFSLLCLVCYECFAPALVGIFIEDPLTREYGAIFLRCMVTAMPSMALAYPMIIQMQATGQIKKALICSVIRKGALDIPLLYLMDTVLSLYGCMLVQPIVDFVSMLLAMYLGRKKPE